VNTRSRMMASIRSKNTQPELTVRHALHALGIRYRLHSKRLSGKPDLVLRRFHAVILVHGCFWHGHRCRFFRLPSSRRGFWRTKINSNRLRDRRTEQALQLAGWRTMTVWECAVREATPADVRRLARRIEHWLYTNKRYGVVTGSKRPAT